MSHAAMRAEIRGEDRVTDSARAGWALVGWTLQRDYSSVT